MAKQKNEAKIKFTAETGEFNDAINKANSTITELRAELKLNAAQMENTGDKVDGLKKKHKLLNDEVQAAKDKVEAITKKLDVARRIFGDNSTEVSKLKTQLANAKTAQTKLETAVKNCAQEIDDATTDTKQFETSLDNAVDDADDLKTALNDAGDAAEDSSDGYTILKDVISDLVSEAISWAIESFKELMTAADSALALLGARTGATSTELEGFEDVMNAIYRNNYGESFEDISDAMSTALQIFGDLDDASLQNITEDAIALRDTFGMDYNESMRAVNSLMDQFGITADEAFNLIVQGAQNGLNQNDDLLDTINEYSVQFEQAGYSADDMFNMLKNGVDSGTWSVDKLGDAVKEFNIRAKDGTVAQGLEDYQKALGLTDRDVKRLSEEVAKGGEEGKLAFGEILTALQGVDDESTRYQAGVALFGTMWEDLGEDTVMALMHTKGEIKSTNEAMDEMKDVRYDTLGDALRELGRVIETDLIQPIVEVLAPIAKEIVEWCIEHIDILGPIIMGVATALGVLAVALGIQSLINGVTKAFSFLNVTMLSNPIVWIVALIAGLVVAFIALWNNCEGFRNFWIGLWENIKTVFNAVAEWLKVTVSGLWESIKTAWEGIKTSVSEAIENAKTAVSEGWEAIKTWTSEKFEAAKTAVTTAWEGIKTAISTVIEGVKTTVSEGWEAVKTWTSEKIEAAKTAVTNAWNAIRTGTSNAFNAVKSIALIAWNGLKSTISGVVDGVKTKVSDVWNGIKTTTANVFNNLRNTVIVMWNNIKTAITRPIETAKTKVKGVIDAIKGFFDFDFTWPHIPLPHFALSPPGWKAGDLFKGSIPSLGIEWYAKGGIMTKPTVFGMNGNNAMIGGEAGPEAILPISKLEDYISDAVEKKMSAVNLEILANSISDLASRPIYLNVNGRQLAIATAGDGDSVNGLRSTFKSRGLALD